jgi:glutaredoxin
MIYRSLRLAFVVGTLASLTAAYAAAQGPVVYRYVDPDGRVVYSDHQPPANAREIEAKRLSPNFIENDQLSLAAQRAQDRFPVTLYTFACGDLCDRAETLLNRRGVPYTKVNVREADGAEKLKKLTGESLVPVLQVGDKRVAKGFSDSEWQALLDDAGYPKSPPLRPPRPPTETPRGPSSPVQSPAAESASGGYPKD